MQQIFDLDLDQHVRWLGTLPHEKVIRELEQADIFVLGCRITENGDRDGIPNVMVESLAMGLPAVGTTVSALPEIIQPGRTGLLVETKTPAQTADALLELLTNNRLRNDCIKAGKELVATSFNNRELIKELAVIYKQAIPSLSCA